MTHLLPEAPRGSQHLMRFWNTFHGYGTALCGGLFRHPAPSGMMRLGDCEACLVRLDWFTTKGFVHVSDGDGEWPDAAGLMTFTVEGLRRFARSTPRATEDFGPAREALSVACGALDALTDSRAAAAKKEERQSSDWTAEQIADYDRQAGLGPLLTALQAADQARKAAAQEGLNWVGSAVDAAQDDLQIPMNPRAGLNNVVDTVAAVLRNRTPAALSEAMATVDMLAGVQAREVIRRTIDQARDLYGDSKLDRWHRPVWWLGQSRPDWLIKDKEDPLGGYPLNIFRPIEVPRNIMVTGGTVSTPFYVGFSDKPSPHSEWPRKVTP